MDAPEVEEALRRLLILSLIALHFIGCSNEKIRSPSESERKLNYQLWGFSAEHRRDGRLRWRVRGRKAVFLKDGRVKITDPLLVIFDMGEKAAVIKGEEGEVDQNREDVKITGEVEGISRKGRFYTQEVIWRDSQGKLFAPGEVKVVKGKSRVWGRKMISDPNMKFIELKEVKFNVRSEDEKHVEELPPTPED
ncbi:TPA: LPS export ABC transporter periplasmic protein LptC [Candidatus Poribacteria bacterium]|nr:LPS export ABC transporter periplasmic protein LptC [Candidatus Poribacteria bacterium]